MKILKEQKKKGEEEIKKKIKEINENQGNNYTIKYYSIYIPIETFDIDEENKDFNSIPKENIELIDIPGFKDSKFEKQKYLKDLIEFCDGFVFSFNSINIEDQETQDFISIIMEYIKEKNNTFYFNNCLFNLNYIDELNNNEIEKNVEDFKKILKKILVKKIYTCNIIDRLKLKQSIKDIDKINVSYFSNIIYQKYQLEIFNVNNLKILDIEEYKNNLEDLYEYLKEEYEEFDNNDKIDENKLNEKIKQIKNYINHTNNNETIEKLGKLLISIVENKKRLPKYKNSYASSFLENFKKQLVYSYENNMQIKIKKSLDYIINFLFKLSYINNLCKNPEKIKEASSINIRKNIINNKYNKLIKNIEKKFLNLSEDINRLEKDINIKCNNKNISLIQIKNIMDENNINDSLNYLVNVKKNEINDIFSYFSKFCSNQFSKVLEGKLPKVVDDIILNFEAKFQNYYSGLRLSLLSFYNKNTLYYFSLFLLGFVPLLNILTAISFGIYERFKSNELKINDLFKPIRDDVGNFKKESISQFENYKNNFISKLENLQEFSEKEIKFLINNTFIEKYKGFIENIKEAI